MIATSCFWVSPLWRQATEIQLQRITGDRADSKLNNFALGGTREVRQKGNLRGSLSSRLNIILWVLLHCSLRKEHHLRARVTPQNTTGRHTFQGQLYNQSAHFRGMFFFIGCFSEMTGAKAGTRTLGSVGGVCVRVCVHTLGVERQAVSSPAPCG